MQIAIILHSLLEALKMNWRKPVLILLVIVVLLLFKITKIGQLKTENPHTYQYIHMLMRYWEHCQERIVEYFLQEQAG